MKYTAVGAPTVTEFTCEIVADYISFGYKSFRNMEPSSSLRIAPNLSIIYILKASGVVVLNGAKKTPVKRKACKLPMNSIELSGSMNEICCGPFVAHS